MNPISDENARDVVEAIDELIKLRATMSDYWTSSSKEEQCELLKRRITDYLLVTDPRSGVYQTGRRE